MSPKIKKYLFQYSFEFIVIVLGISLSFVLEDIRQKNELKKLSKELVDNLINELDNVTIYCKERERIIKKDIEIARLIRSSPEHIDSLLAVTKTPFDSYLAVFNYRGFKPPNAFYSSMISDGSIKYIESKEIKKLLDELQNWWSYFINENINDEVIYQRKIIDYFIDHHPEFYMRSENSEEDVAYLIALQKIFYEEPKASAILMSKASSMKFKVFGLNKYLLTLEKLKEHLKENY